MSEKEAFLPRILGGRGNRTPLLLLASIWFYSKENIFKDNKIYITYSKVLGTAQYAALLLSLSLHHVSRFQPQAPHDDSA